MLHEENTNKTPTIRPRYRIVQSMNSWLIMKHSKVPAQSDREPVDDLNNRDKADSKAETAKPSKAGDEVEPRHLGGALELCKERWQFIE